MERQYRFTKWGCFFSNSTMALISILPPLLFLSFHQLYGISYGQLGFLIFVNFSTQLIVDLLLSFWPDKLRPSFLLRLMPSLVLVGFSLYIATPILFPNRVYPGLLAGTMLFSSASGISEVLITPVVAALPCEDPQREISFLHSMFAWTEVLIVLVCTAFFVLMDSTHWYLLVLLWLFLPFFTLIFFCMGRVPALGSSEPSEHSGSICKQPLFILCCLCMLTAGATECTMSQWSSSYLEQALHIPKMLGDLFGVALFALMLGVGRSLYTKYGSNLRRWLIMGTAGSVVCYLFAAFTLNPLIGLASCAMTGFCVSMLWPGTLILLTDYFPAAGVTAFAFMAAGGDLGASLGPQLIGLITDSALRTPQLIELAGQLNLSPDQLGLKLGLLLAALFPLTGLVFYHFLKKPHVKTTV